MVPWRMLPLLVFGVMIPSVVIVTVLSWQSGQAHATVPVALSLFVVPVIAVRVVLLLAGWDALARAYAASASDLAEATWDDMVASIALRRPGLRLNNCIMWSATPTHLLLRVAPPFHLGVRSVRIAWSDVARREAANSEMVELILRADRPAPVRVFVPKPMVKM